MKRPPTVEMKPKNWNTEMYSFSCAIALMEFHM